MKLLNFILLATMVAAEIVGGVWLTRVGNVATLAWVLLSLMSLVVATAVVLDYPDDKAKAAINVWREYRSRQWRVLRVYYPWAVLVTLAAMGWWWLVILYVLTRGAYALAIRMPEVHKE